MNTLRMRVLKNPGPPWSRSWPKSAPPRWSKISPKTRETNRNTNPTPAITRKTTKAVGLVSQFTISGLSLQKLVRKVKSCHGQSCHAREKVSGGSDFGSRLATSYSGSDRINHERRGGDPAGSLGFSDRVAGRGPDRAQ